MCVSLPSQSLSSLHLLGNDLKYWLFTARKKRWPDWNPLWSDIMLTQCEGTHVHLEEIQTCTTYYSLIGFAGLSTWGQFVLGTRFLVSGLLAWLPWIVCVIYLAMVIQGMRKARPWYPRVFRPFHRFWVEATQEPSPSPAASPSCHLVSSQKYVRCPTISESIGHDEWNISLLT